ncbi:MAG: hypothetical protein Q9208_005073 [Pyrenodesmia sp. 3 TL-2023]
MPGQLVLLPTSLIRLPAVSLPLPYSVLDFRHRRLSLQQEPGVRLKSSNTSPKKSQVSKPQPPSVPQTSRLSRVFDMGSKVNYNALRAQAVETSNDEAVTVNMKSLIDKILARYARKWSTLRELIQNAADAGATRVVIKIETRPSVRVPSPQTDDPSTRLRHALQHHTIDKWIVENNGMRFRREDWARVKEIASGNPDETKIGAFGVGFYSVFDVTKNPFISSGYEALEFYWKGNGLFTRSFQLGMLQSTDTTFVLPMRDSNVPVPHGKELFTLCQFLTRSMTFVGLESIELCIDEWTVLRLQKTIPGSVNVNIPSGIRCTTSNNLMRVTKVSEEAIQLEAEWIAALQWSAGLREGPGNGNALEPTKKKLASFLFKSLGQSTEKPAQEGRGLATNTAEDMTIKAKQKTFFHVNRAAIQTSVGDALSTEFVRCRNKVPPKATTLSYLSQSYDERAASTVEKRTIASELFEYAMPTTTGVICIGFETSQTTGLGAHISIPSLIPTVEREHIDLTSNHINTWNIELLRAAGIVTRICWSSAMANFRRQQSKLASIAQGKALTSDELQQVVPSVDSFKTFDWKKTTPRSDVGVYVEEAFWSCSSDFEILSSRGIVPHKNVRVAAGDLSFIEELPMVPEPLLKTGLVESLRKGGDLADVQTDDIVWILDKSQRTRTPTELQQLLAYIAGRGRANRISKAEVHSILKVAVATDEEEGSTRVIALGEIKYYVDPMKLPPDMPIPPNTIPFKYTKTLSKFDTETLGFQELHIPDWIRWLVGNRGSSGQLSSKYNAETNPVFAANVLKVLSKNWSGFTQESKMSTVQLLDNTRIIPTKMGMKIPSDAYFSSVKLFDDLPVVRDIANVKEPVLAALGVRKTLEIGVVLERLMGGSSQTDKADSKWSHVDLIKYLVGVWADVPERDRERLKRTPICPSTTSSGQADEQKYQVSALYEPTEALHQLGLPTLQWPGPYIPGSKEGRLLRILGLRDAPPYTDLVNIIATAGQAKNMALRDYGIRYLIENHQSKGYNVAATAEVKTPFLPVHGFEDKLAAPSDCFTNEAVGFFGFDLLKKHLHQYAAQLGVRSDPPVERCIRRLLRKPPQSKRHARDIFTYMTSRLGVLTNEHIDILAAAKIVPVVGSGSRDSGVSTAEAATSDVNGASMNGGRLRYTTPRMCFLGDGGDFRNIFDFVDFGPEANMFLMRCGSKQEPSPVEMAHLLTRRPAKFLDELKVTKYMDVLVMIAKAWDTLKQDKLLVEAMKQAPFLLGSKEAAPDGNPNNQDDEDEGVAKTWQLAKASEIIIIGDHIINYQLFKSSVLAAPQQDETLEDLYIHLGAPSLGSLIEERQKFGEFTSDQSSAQKLQTIIHERARLYLHQTPKEAIRHDAKWVEKSVSVQAVKSIVVRTSLKGQDIKHTQSRTATLHKEGSRWVIYVTSNYEIWDVSQALASLLLLRSKPGDAMMLESILRSDLRSLQRKGLNIDKILRQKERDAKVAQEMHEQQLEQERRARMEQESVEEEEVEKQQDGDTTVTTNMPGDFPGSSPAKGPEEEDSRQSQGFLTDTLRKWGINVGRKPWTNGENDVDGNRAAPSKEDLKDLGLDPDADVDGGEPQEGPQETPSAPKKPLQPMTPEQVASQVQQAIQSSRPHTSTSLRSQSSVHKVEERHETCDARPGMKMLYGGHISNMPLFLDEDYLKAANTTGEKFISTHREGLHLFKSVLDACTTIYNVPKESIHIFYDTDSNTRAFNKANSLFFNYRMFIQQEHLAMIQRGQKETPICVWSGIMAHEMA